jgi:hypothetical protein
VTTDPTPDDIPFDVPDLGQPDLGLSDLGLSDLGLPDDPAIRRAVRRGLLLTGLVAAAWLLLATVVLYVLGVVVVAVHTEHFHDVAYYGAQVGRPGYAVTGNGCCTGSLGLANAQDLDMLPRGAVPGGGLVTGRVSQTITGRFGSALPDNGSTPVGAALQRPRPTKEGTAAFLNGLPPSVSASAVVEFNAPVDGAALDRIPLGGSPSGDRALLLADPYAGPVVSWPEHDLSTFSTWVAALTAADTDALAELGAPSVADLRLAAGDPRIYAVVVERTTLDELRTLLANPQVRSVNVAEIGFDPARQTQDN